MNINIFLNEIFYKKLKIIKFYIFQKWKKIIIFELKFHKIKFNNIYLLNKHLKYFLDPRIFNNI